MGSSCFQGFLFWAFRKYKDEAAHPPFTGVLNPQLYLQCTLLPSNPNPNHAVEVQGLGAKDPSDTPIPSPTYPERTAS